MRKLILVVAALMAAGSVAGAEAQVCVGNPLGRGGWSVGLGTALGDGFTNYGFGASAHVIGDFYTNASYNRTHYEPASPDAPDVPDANFVSGGLAFQAQAGGAFICPNLSLEYGWHAFDSFGFDFLEHGVRVNTFDEVDARYLSIPLGVSVGAPLGSLDETYLLPTITAGAFFTQTRWDAFRFPINSFGQQIAQAYKEEFRETDTHGFASVGLTFGYRFVFLSGGLSMTTAEGAEPVASLGFGLAFE